MRFNTPLRYPGGKRKLTKFARLLFEQNGLTGGHYVEPYAGGAGLALSLLLLEYASHIHLNDISRPVYAFWYSVLKQPAALCQMIADCRVTMAEWSRQKAVQDSPQRHGRLKLGFSTFFLNRTNRSGILKGGVIGGKNQDGPWKLTARFNKGDLITRIETIARYSDRISLHNQDAEEFIREVIPRLPEKTLVYLDPPYYVKGADLYEDHYEHKDHARVSALVGRIKKKPWIVSYDNVPEIRRLYKNYKQIKYGLNYSAQNRYAGSEVMVFSPGLAIPQVHNPTNLR